MSLSLKLLNLAISANCQARLKLLAHKVINWQIGPWQSNFIISQEGSLSQTSQPSDCQIIVPYTLINHIGNFTTLNAYRQLIITGDKELAHNFLLIISQLDLTRLPYLVDKPLWGIIYSSAFHKLKQLINYSKLVSSNARLSINHYLQYETPLLSNHYQLSQFYAAVDQLAERTEVLTKRLKRLQQLS